MTTAIIVLAISLAVVIILRQAKRRPGFYTKVVGISHHQTSARSCSVGERVQLIREPRNAQDANAIKVCRHNGRPLGYLKPHLAAELVPDIDSGARFEATVSDITGGTKGKPTVGINLHINRIRP